MKSRVQDVSKIVFSTTSNINFLNMAINNRDQRQRVTSYANGSANGGGEVKFVEIPSFEGNPLSKGKRCKLFPKAARKAARNLICQIKIYIQEDVCLMVIPIYAKMLWS